jgi:hypothetical protein
MTGVILKGHLLMTNYHLFSSFKDVKKWRLINHSLEFEVDLTNRPAVTCDKEKFGDRDVVLIGLPRNVPQHRDITKFFMTQEDFAYFSSIEWVSLLGWSPSNPMVLRQYFSNKCEARDLDFNLVDSNAQRHVRQYFRYGIQTKPGDCGSLMIAFDKERNRKIAGIHMAGMHNVQFQGVAQAIHQGVIANMEERMEPHVTLESFISCDPKGLSDLKVCNVAVSEAASIVTVQTNSQGAFMHLGRLEKPVYQNDQSNIRKSPLYGVIAEPTTKPAHLKPFRRGDELVKPMELALKKASAPSLQIDDDLIAECATHVRNLVLMNRRPGDDKFLTHEEAIKGVEGDEFLQGVNRNTSPGYGWPKKGKGKFPWMADAAGDWKLDDPELKAACDNIREAGYRGERPCTFWTDTLKDERRPIEKVEAGKTRLFSAGEMAYTVVFRQMFLPFIAHMMRNRIEFEATVGINVYSFEWTEMITKLFEVGNKFAAGDFQNFDQTLLGQILWAIFHMIIIPFYGGREKIGEEAYKLMISLWSEIVYSVHVHGDEILGWTHSQPSGCPITTILNCLFQMIAFRIAFLLCALKYCQKYADLSYFSKFVRAAFYGDDSLLCIADAIIEWFNQLTMKEAFADIGMTYTDEGKTGEMQPWRRLHEVAFLKRGFRWDEQQVRFRAPLSLVTIREMAMWVHGTTDVHQLTAITLAEAVHELAQHDRATFDREFPAFEKAQFLLRAKTEIHTYDYYQKIESLRWCTGIAQSKPRDRGQAQMTEGVCAANPAEVRPGRQGYPEARREGYSPLLVEVCPPEYNRLSTQSISPKIESSHGMNI